MADREAPEGRDWLALLGRGLSGVLLLVAGGLGLAATGHVDALPPHPLQGALSLHLALTSIGLSLGLVLRRRIGWTRRRPGPRALLLSGLAYLGLAATLTLAGLNLALGCLAPIGEPAGPLSLALLAVPGLVGLRLAADLLPAASVFSDAGVASGATPIADLIPFAATAARARPLARLSDALHTGLATLLFVGAVVVCVVSGIVYGLHLRDAFVVGEITYGPDLLAQIHAALGRLMASPPGMFTLGAAPALVALIEAGPFFRDCARLWRAPAYNRPLGPDELARLAAAHRALADHLARTPAVGGPGNAVLVRFVPLLALVLPSGVLIAAVTGGLTQGFLARVAAAGRVPDTGWRWYLDPLGAGDILLVAALTFAVMSLPALIGLVRPAFGRRLALQALLARASAPDLSEAIAEALAVELRLGRLGAFRTDDARLYLRRRSIEIGLRQGLALLALALLAAGLFALDRRAYDLFTEDAVVSVAYWTGETTRVPYEDVDAVSTLCRPALAGARLVYRIHLPGGARVDLGRHAAGPDPSALDNLAEVDARLRRAGVPVLDAGGAGRAGWKLTEELACWQALGGLADEAVRARVLELFRPATPDQAF